MVAGATAGCLGALVGIGGGALIVPVLHSVIGLPFREATAASLVGVLATSSSAGMAPSGRQLHNARLAILLLIFSVSGAAIGGQVITRFSDRTFEVIFGGAAALIAAAMFVRLNRREGLPEGSIEPGVLGDRLHDHDSGAEVVYRVKRVPLAAGMSFGAGMLTSFVGIGGGILIVPMLNTLCGVPLRAAAATSVLMIGVTAVPSLAVHWANGYLGDYHMAAMTGIGVLAGFRAGLAISARTRVRGLKVVMAAILVVVAVHYLAIR